MALSSNGMEIETILILGGRDSSGPHEEIFLLKGDKWIKLSLKLPEGFDNGGGVYLDGELYIFGGSNSKELYKLDNKTLKWIRLADMNERRDGIPRSCLEWNGSIWVFGGYDNVRNRHLASVERYDLKENKWIELPEMIYSKSYSTASVCDGKFLMCGGNDSGDFLRIVECFDPEIGVWTVLNDMPVSGHPNSLLSYGNNSIITGSYGGKTHFYEDEESLEGEERWKELPPLKEPRQSFAVAKLDNEVYIIGGYNGTNTTDPYLKQVEIFNGESWRDGPPLPYGSWNMISVVIPHSLVDILCNYNG